jgi:hypothetical protein
MARRIRLEPPRASRKPAGSNQPLICLLSAAAFSHLHRCGERVLRFLPGGSRNKQGPRGARIRALRAGSSDRFCASGYKQRSNY